MKRGGPLKRSDKQMAPGGLNSPTKAEAELHQTLRDMGCAVCLFVLKIEDTPAEIHHLLDGQRRISHSHVLPICPVHHRQGVQGHPSRHSVNGCHGGLDVFEREYGQEMDLVIKCEDWINQPYVTGLEADERTESTESGNGGDTDSHAECESHNQIIEKEPVRIREMQKIGWPVHISVTHYLHWEPDMDNLNAKGAIDGLVKAGILEDDKRKYVRSVQHEYEPQPRSTPEKTVITLTEVI